MNHRLKEIRTSRGLSQRDLAKITGISQSYITAIERNVRDMDLRLIGIFAKALECKPYELLPLEWQPHITEEDLKLLNAIKSFTANKENEEQAQNTQTQKENER